MEETWRQYSLALMQASPACKNHELTCEGGKYGPPSPQFDMPAPVDPLPFGVNRSYDPETSSKHRGAR
jgi:hypothetical protein